MSTPGERWARRVWGDQGSASGDWEAVSRARWDAAAADWDRRIGKDFERGWRADVLSFMRRLMGDRAPQTVLDAGCGAGHLALALAQAGHHAAGIDLSPAMIDAALARFAEAGLTGDFHVADLGAIGFPDAAFDVVACLTAIEWTPDPVGALAEFARLLKPGGLLVVGILSALSPIRAQAYQRFLGAQTAQNTLMPWELARLLVDLGWTVAAETPSGWLDGYDEAARHAAQQDPRLGQCICGIWLVGARQSNRP